MLIDTGQFTPKRIDAGASLPPGETALLIVDMMARFCDARWLAGGDEARAQWFEDELDRVIPAIQLALEAFRASGGLVVHAVNAKWTPAGREAVPYQRGRDYGLFDTEPMSPIAPLAPAPGEVVVRKVASSAFTGTGLDYLLQNAGIRNLVLCGQYGNACVFYSLIQGREFGFANYWLEDGILYGSEADKHLFGALVGARWATLAPAREVVHALGNR